MSIKNRGFASMTPQRREELSRKGGLKSSNGRDMSSIGKLGGQATALRGREYYSRIGKVGGTSRGKLCVYCQGRGTIQLTIPGTPYLCPKCHGTGRKPASTNSHHRIEVN